MKKLMPGMVLSLLFVGLGAWVFAQSGFFPIAASSPVDMFDELAPQVRDRAITRHARSVSSLPGTSDAASVQRGLVEYRESCMPCHGAPGGSAAEFSQGLN